MGALLITDNTFNFLKKLFLNCDINKDLPMAGIIHEYEDVFDDCRQAGLGAMLFDRV